MNLSRHILPAVGALLSGCLLTACNHEGVESAQSLSPYAAKVWAYCPAPGQFVNVLPAWEDGKDMLEEADKAICGKRNGNMISLGAWGGYIVVAFDHDVVNLPDTFDFRVLGNAFSGSGEAGIVMVSADENGNSIPDDPWYELAGSEYSATGTVHDYRCVYYRPADNLADILWKDNRGDSGYVLRNVYHDQSYYPLWESADSLVFTGARLASNAYEENGQFYHDSFAWGYADNLPNDGPGSCFDIGWAVDSAGKSVKLEKIRFVKVYTALRESLGQLGEISTEICGFEDVNFDIEQ